MWIRSSGAVTENVFQITTAVSSHFLISGSRTALVDTGIMSLASKLEEDVVSVLGEDRALDVVFLTHAHFDHVGGVASLRRKYPRLMLVTGPQTMERITDKSWLEEAYQKNLDAAAAMQSETEIGFDEWSKALIADRIFGDGDVVDLGGDVEVKVIATPGHTDDCVSFFVLPDSALACSEVIGSYAGREKVYPCFGSSYKDYLKSIERISSLQIQVLGFPHCGSLSGDLVSRYLIQARAAAETFYQGVSQRLSQGELVHEIAESFLPEWRSQNICPEGPFMTEQEYVLTEMVKACRS